MRLKPFADTYSEHSAEFGKHFISRDGSGALSSEESLNLLRHLELRLAAHDSGLGGPVHEHPVLRTKDRHFAVLS